MCACACAARGPSSNCWVRGVHRAVVAPRKRPFLMPRTANSSRCLVLFVLWSSIELLRRIHRRGPSESWRRRARGRHRHCPSVIRRRVEQRVAQVLGAVRSLHFFGRGRPKVNHARQQHANARRRGGPPPTPHLDRISTRAGSSYDIIAVPGFRLAALPLLRLEFQTPAALCCVVHQARGPHPLAVAATSRARS